jgi:hypothetical protein
MKRRASRFQAIIEEAALDGGWLETRSLANPSTTHHTRTHKLVFRAGVMALRSVLRPGWQTRQRPNASAARPPVVGLRSV